MDVSCLFMSQERRKDIEKDRYWSVQSRHRVASFTRKACPPHCQPLLSHVWFSTVIGTRQINADLDVP